MDNDKKINVVVYCRASTAKQAQKGESIEDQEEYNLNYCNNNGLTIVKIFRESFSGKTSNRPALNEAIEFIRKSKIKIEYFIIHKIDRGSRGEMGEYQKIKKELKALGTNLRDTYGIIQSERKVVDVSGIETDHYEWAYENPSEYAELGQVLQAKNDRLNILRRTITQEIKNAKRGYQVREANYGFKNIKIVDETGKKRTVMVENSDESKFVKEMFKLASLGTNAINICKTVNEMGYKSRERIIWSRDGLKKIGANGGVKLKPNRLDQLLKNPIYSGVRKEKWTGGLPIKTPYPGLVSIELFNQANKGKIRITENKDGNIEIFYGEESSLIPVIKKRLNYNPEYPYSKVLCCPKCKSYLTPSRSKSKSGRYHHYYQCQGKGGEKHLNYTIKKDDTNNAIINFIRNIKLNSEIIDYFNNEVLPVIWNEREKEIEQTMYDVKNRLKELNDKKISIIQSIDKLVNYPEILEAKNKELQEIKVEINKYETELSRNVIGNDINLDTFKTATNLLLTHLEEMASEKEEPVFINIAFSIIFVENPSIEEIQSHTPKVFPLFALESQSKNTEMCGNDTFLRWQPHGESNPG